MRSVEVLVVGSINADVVLQVARRPAPGETVLASALAVRGGGKGANQAVAAARAGATTALVGAVGDDGWAAQQLADLAACGVDVESVARRDDCGTGVAVITVTPDGENSIVVGSEANATVSADLVAQALSEWQPRVIVAQTEIPAPAVDAAAVAAARLGTRFVLNTAPVVEVAAVTLASADPLVVNEHEAADLLRLAGRDVPGEHAARARDVLSSTNARSLVATLGAAGALVVSADELRHLAAPDVEVVDTTGAGDVFVGTLAAALARGLSLDDAAALAVDAGAVAVTRAGAR